MNWKIFFIGLVLCIILGANLQVTASVNIQENGYVTEIMQHAEVIPTVDPEGDKYFLGFISASGDGHLFFADPIHERYWHETNNNNPILRIGLTGLVGLMWFFEEFGGTLTIRGFTNKGYVKHTYTENVIVSVVAFVGFAYSGTIIGPVEGYSNGHAKVRICGFFWGTIVDDC